MPPVKKPRKLKSESADAPASSRPAITEDERRRPDPRLQNLFEQKGAVDKGALVPVSSSSQENAVTPPSATSVFSSDPTWAQYPFKPLGTSLTLPQEGEPQSPPTQIHQPQPRTPPLRPAPPPPSQVDTKVRRQSEPEARTQRGSKQKNTTIVQYDSAVPVTTGFGATAIHKGTQAQTHIPAKEPKGDSRPLLALLLLVIAGLLAVVGFSQLKQESSTVSQRAPSALEKYRDSIEFHRQMTGTRMNRERIQAEMENSRPLLNPAAANNPLPKRNDLSGLPLLPEAHHRQSSRERTVPANPKLIETEIAAKLQEEAEAQQIEKLERAQYVKDFVANAAAQGYRVKLDKNLNVIQVDRMPQSEQNPSFRPPEEAPSLSVPGGDAAQ